jgi:hypothetical protein
MTSHANERHTRVILIPPSREKDLTQALLFTLRTQAETSSGGEIPHSVRDDRRSPRDGALFTPYASCKR